MLPPFVFREFAFPFLFSLPAPSSSAYVSHFMLTELLFHHSEFTFFKKIRDFSNYQKLSAQQILFFPQKFYFANVDNNVFGGGEAAVGKNEDR